MVVLDDNLVDEDGMPAPKMIYKNNENTRRMTQFNVEKAAQSLREAGAYEILEAPFVRETGWHMLGTCVMGSDARTSVVDGECRAHDCANLFIFDGSVMPTGSCVNPTGTVAALALRGAELIAEKAREQKVSLQVA
jgi:choline dehydrogenase-like flavoprotein